MGDENKKLDSFWGLVKEAAIDLLDFLEATWKLGVCPHLQLPTLSDDEDNILYILLMTTFHYCCKKANNVTWETKKEYTTINNSIFFFFFLLNKRSVM